MKFLFSVKYWFQTSWFQPRHRISLTVDCTMSFSNCVKANPLVIEIVRGTDFMYKLHWPTSTFAGKCGVHRIFLTQTSSEAGNYYSACTNFAEWVSLNSSDTTELTVIKLCMRQLHQYCEVLVISPFQNINNKPIPRGQPN